MRGGPAEAGGGNVVHRDGSGPAVRCVYTVCVYVDTVYVCVTDGRTDGRTEAEALTPCGRKALGAKGVFPTVGHVQEAVLVLLLVVELSHGQTETHKTKGASHRTSVTEEQTCDWPRGRSLDAADKGGLSNEHVQLKHQRYRK